MANNLASGQIVAARMWCVLGAQATVTTWHYRVATVGSPQLTDSDFAQVVDGALQTGGIKSILANPANYQGVQAQIIWPLPVMLDQGYVANAGVGTGGSAVMPGQVRGISSWYAAIAGKKGRGRSYWPFPPQALSVAATGVPSSTYVAFTGALNTALLGITSPTVSGRTATTVMCLYNRFTHATVDILNYSTHLRFATQRKSGVYGRPNSSPI